jgi:hypothetical protein
MQLVVLPLATCMAGVNTGTLANVVVLLAVLWQDEHCNDALTVM